LFGFGPSARIDINFKKRKGGAALSYRPAEKNWATVEDGNATPEMVVFQALDQVDGTIRISVPGGKAVEHMGIKAELVGQVEYMGDRSGSFPILSLTRELEAAGSIVEKTYDFEFNLQKDFDSYNGNTAKLRYFIRVVISRNYASNITYEQDFMVENYIKAVPEINPAIKMEVGVEDCLHIEFEYEREKYHLDDVITGKINFMLVRIKIKSMELQILKKETTGTGSSAATDTETLYKFEIMDGAPVRGETVPIRLYLTPVKLTPTMINVHQKFSVRYFLNLVLLDEEERRYFKQHEITLYRSPIETAEAKSTS